jgi:very-short-patch-repair endonuclease
MRLNPTDAERKLWQYLRKRQLKNRKFLRQHPIFYEHWKNDSFCFIPDFYCYQEKLAVELDGPIHEMQIEEDTRRDKILSNMGIRILRIKNSELNNIDKVLEKISAMFNEE